MNDVTYKWDEPKVVQLPLKDITEQAIKVYEAQKVQLQSKTKNK